MRCAWAFFAALVLAACEAPEEPKLPRPEPPKPTALQTPDYAPAQAKEGPGVLIVCPPIADPDYGDCCAGRGGITRVGEDGAVLCADGTASATCRCE